MSETTTTPDDPPTPAEPVYGEPVTKSDVGSPNALEGSESEPTPEPEKPVEAKPVEAKPREDWRETRLRQQTARIAAEARRANDAEQRLAAYEAATKPPSEAEATKPAQTQEDYRQAVMREASAIAEANTFNESCNRIADQGSKEFGEGFGQSVKTLWEATDGLDAAGNLTPRARSLIDAAMETDAPHAVLHHLGQNPDEAMRIAAISSDAKRGAAVAKLASGLSAPAPARPISRAPAPIEPINGSARAEVGASGPKEIGAWMKWEESRIKALKNQ